MEAAEAMRRAARERVAEEWADRCLAAAGSLHEAYKAKMAAVVAMALPEATSMAGIERARYAELLACLAAWEHAKGEIER